MNYQQIISNYGIKRPVFNAVIVKQQQNFIPGEGYWQNLERSFVFQLESFQKKQKHFPCGLNHSMEMRKKK